MHRVVKCLITQGSTLRRKLIKFCTDTNLNLVDHNVNIDTPNNLHLTLVFIINFNKCVTLLWFSVIHVILTKPNLQNGQIKI